MLARMKQVPRCCKRNVAKLSTSDQDHQAEQVSNGNYFYSLLYWASSEPGYDKSVTLFPIDCLGPPT